MVKPPSRRDTSLRKDSPEPGIGVRAMNENMSNRGVEGGVKWGSYKLQAPSCYATCQRLDQTTAVTK